jgi:serine/threonine protein kinase
VTAPNRRRTKQLLAALERLHAQRLIHRDIKPQNVFMTTQGTLKLGDFGLATSIAEGRARERVGTPSYIAPEVLEHAGYGPAVDVWGVGCLAMEMMTLAFLSERDDGMLAMQARPRPAPYRRPPRAPAPR